MSGYLVTIFEDEDGKRYGVNPFATQSELKEPKHYLVCSSCNLTFTSKLEFDNHNIKVHGQRKSLSCELCSAIFRRQDHLKRHIQSLHTNYKYNWCPVCDKDCRRQDMVIRHIKKKHDMDNDLFHCRECSFQTQTFLSLEKHEQTHLLTDRHVCTYCSMSFKRKDHMLRHVKSQHLNQSADCPICGQKYKRKDHVVRHVREKHQMGLLNGKLVKSSDIL